MLSILSTEEGSKGSQEALKVGFKPSLFSDRSRY